MLETYNSNAIIINRKPYRESDLLVSLYSSNYGRMDLIARGGLKMESKLSGHVEPIILASIMVIAGKKLNYIGTSIAQNCYVNIKNDSIKLFYASLAVEIINKKTRINDEVDSNLIFNLISDYLNVLETYKLTQNDCKILYSFFVLKFMSYIGFLPELNHCCQCQTFVSSEQENNYFSINRGGILCYKCSQEESNVININSNTLSILQFIISNDFNKLNHFRVKNKSDFNSLNNIINLFYKYYLA